jgi:negative regulator of sigma E activity
MKRLKGQFSKLDAYPSSGQRAPEPPAASLRPIQAARRRRQLHPFFFRLGPVGLSICSVLLVSLMAVLYLSQLNQAVAANQQIQQLKQQQIELQRENQDLLAQIAQEQSPLYILQHAKTMGLVPADPKSVTILVIPGLKPTRDGLPGQP